MIVPILNLGRPIWPRSSYITEMWINSCEIDGGFKADAGLENIFFFAPPSWHFLPRQQCENDRGNVEIV
jgi:hypothetical protein